MYLTGKVPQDSKDSYIDMAKFGTVVEVVEKKDEQTEVLFCGILSDISIEKVQDVYYLSLHAKTATYFMDTKLKSFFSKFVYDLCYINTKYCFRIYKR